MKKLAVIFLLLGCAQFGERIDSENFVVTTAVKNIGYSLGLLASSNPGLRDQVEIHYGLIKTGSLTAAMATAAIRALEDEGPAYQILAINLIDLISAVGGQVIGFEVVSLSAIDPRLIEIGKMAYLTALQATGAGYVEPIKPQPPEPIPPGPLPRNKGENIE